MSSTRLRCGGSSQSSARHSGDWRPLVGLALLLVVSGCAPHPTAGLRPVPPHMPGITGDRITRDAKSLQPTLRWEAFPRSEDLKADKTGRLADARNVTYELRIWRAEDPCSLAICFPGEVVYVRSGMTEPVHTVEAPLAPDTVYLWTMRARFELHGEPRVTQWGVLILFARPDEPVIPHPGYYRFKTPGR